MAARKLWTNFSKGELSPKIEGRSDLAAYFEGAIRLENWLLMRQGGLTSRPGLRFIHEVKDSTKDTILLPFEASVDDAYIVEVGDLYMRFYRDRALIESGGTPVEISSPYMESQLRRIHFTQSVDVLFMFNLAVRQHRLSRVSHTSWSLNPIVAQPPPSLEADTSLGAATLTPAATSGTNVIFTASSAVFLAGDVGRLIIAGAARAIITAFGSSAGDTGSPNDHVRADILDPFPNTNPISGWKLRLSPQATLDPDKRGPVGAQVTLVASVNSFRGEDEGKYIKIYAGLVKITQFVSATTVKGEILAEMAGTDDVNPAAAPIGSWSLEVESWSPENGFPRTGEFVQGRLGQASTEEQKTTWWLSRPDDFDSYATGVTADSAIEYTIAARRLNAIEWMNERGHIFFGTSGSEQLAKSGREDEPIGGDHIPFVKGTTTIGSAAIQAVAVGNRLVFVDRSLQRVFAIFYDIEQDDYDALEITGAADHIMAEGVRLGAIAVTHRLDPRVYFVRTDGQLVVLTFNQKEKVIGFTRIITDGLFESVAAIPRAGGGPDQVYVIVKRGDKRFVEMFEENYETLSREWKSLQTDSSIVYKGASTTVVTGLGHLEGETVQVVAGSSYIGTKIVSGAQIVLTEAATEIEVGKGFVSTLTTMRPALEGMVLEGIPRSWNKLFARLYQSFGGFINNEALQYDIFSIFSLFSGDKEITGQGWDLEGRVTVERREPYPMNVLAIFGTLETGQSD